jgi:hypothetical protein
MHKQAKRVQSIRVLLIAWDQLRIDSQRSSNVGDSKLQESKSSRSPTRGVYFVAKG